MSNEPLLDRTDRGFYCPPGGFYIDPWKPVDRAVVTHAHADHARRGSRRYLAAEGNEHILRRRMGPEPEIDVVPYGSVVAHRGVRISLHPAGHVLGSAQVRIEHRGRVAVVSGDYKTGSDPTCRAFDPVPCHLFVTECTFGLPVYRWPSQESVFEEINAWWRANRDAGIASLLFGYALGKSQRLLAGLEPEIGPIVAHGAVQALVEDYRKSGVRLPETEYATGRKGRGAWAGVLVVAPPHSHGSAWARRFGPASTAFASGWMRLRGTRRRRAVDRGFVLSDHVDWPSLLDAIRETGAETVWATHGYTTPVVRWLRERGIDASAVSTRFEGETDDADASAEASEAAADPPAPADSSTEVADSSEGSADVADRLPQATDSSDEVAASIPVVSSDAGSARARPPTEPKPAAPLPERRAAPPSEREEDEQLRLFD